MGARKVFSSRRNGRDDQTNFRNEMFISKTTENKVSAHLDVVSTSYAHRNIIFTQRSKFRPILVLVLAPASKRFVESKNIKRACVVITYIFHTMFSHNICIRTLYGPKRGEFPANCKILNFKKKHLGSYFPDRRLSGSHGTATSSVRVPHSTFVCVPLSYRGSQ